MKKGLDWVIQEIHTTRKVLADSESSGNETADEFTFNNGKEEGLVIALKLLDQLDEPETLSQEWVDKHKVDYHNWIPAVPIDYLQNLLVPDLEEVDRAYKDGYEKGKQHTFYKGYLEGLGDKGSEPEVLSQEWIDEHIDYADVRGGTQAFIHVEDLQNLLVPTLSKAETVQITEEQVMEWLDNNEFYCHATAETVLENAVDKGELGYYGTKYSVVKKPVIPSYVAKWISERREIFDLYPALKRLENSALSWEDVYEWYRKNTRTFVDAYLTGKYEVEEEQKYIVRLPSSMQDAFPIVALGRTDKGNLSVRKNRVGTNLTLHDKYLLTEQEIKDYDERFWPFAVKVKELEE